MSMRASCWVVTALVFVAPGLVRGADTYAVDAVHSSAGFQASHLGLSWIQGRFKAISGSFTVDPNNPAATRFELTAQVNSIDTDNGKRDEHLKGPDFFNAKQFPTVSFRSTSAKPVQGGYEVTGDLALHGATKPVSFMLKGGKTAEFPRGVHRTGYTGEFTIKRSDFGMDKMLEAIGDEVHVMVSFEGTRK